MLATPHFLFGAACGRLLQRRPWLIAVVALGSHFLLDATPHLDAHALFGRETGGMTTPEIAMAAADTAFGLALLIWIAAARLKGQSSSQRAVLLGAFLAMLIDGVDHLPPWGEWFSTWPGTAWLSAFHHAFQTNVRPAQWLLGISTQLAVSIVALVLLLREDRPHSP